MSFKFSFSNVRKLISSGLDECPIAKRESHSARAANSHAFAVWHDFAYFHSRHIYNYSRKKKSVVNVNCHNRQQESTLLTSWYTACSKHQFIAFFIYSHAIYLFINRPKKRTHCGWRLFSVGLKQHFEQVRCIPKNLTYIQEICAIEVGMFL